MMKLDMQGDNKTYNNDYDYYTRATRVKCLYNLAFLCTSKADIAEAEPTRCYNCVVNI
jgi:hypothetical protein